jgi:ribosomal RNA assembly protein
MRYVKIPMDRIPVLVGTDGEVKDQIEREGVTLAIDSKTGDVRIYADSSLKELNAENVVRLVGRGFSPEHALLLMNEDYYFTLYDLRDWVGKKPHQIRRVAGRIIGRNGKSRRVIEDLTDTHISVYGHTVGIIGRIGELQAAQQAIEMLLEGSAHPSVYRFLEKNRKRRKMEEFGL